MTATVTETTETKAGGVGRISRIIGPVVDVEFPVDAMPDLYNLLTAEVQNTDGSGAPRSSTSRWPNTSATTWSARSPAADRRSGPRPGVQDTGGPIWCRWVT